MDAIVESLGAAAGDADDIVQTLRSSSRETRARGLARTLSEVAAAIEQARMRY